MKMNNPWIRILRRFVVAFFATGIPATLATGLLDGKLDMRAVVISLVAAVIMGLDKLSREEI